MFARQQLEEDRPQRIDVGAPVGGMALPLGLFGRHVGRCSKNLSLHGHRDLARLPLSESKIRDVRLTRAVDQDVARLQVTMNDALLMGVMQRLADFDTEPSRVVVGGPLPGQPVVQRESFDEVADDVYELVCQTHFMHTDDVRMVDLCRCPGLAKESFDFRQVEPAFVRDLHGHEAIQLKVPGLPHRSEPTRPQQFDQLKMADVLVRRRRLAVASRPVLRLIGDQAELAPAGRAHRFGKLFVRRQGAPAMAVRTTDIESLRVNRRGVRGVVQSMPLRGGRRRRRGIDTPLLGSGQTITRRRLSHN